MILTHLLDFLLFVSRKIRVTRLFHLFNLNCSFLPHIICIHPPSSSSCTTLRNSTSTWNYIFVYPMNIGSFLLYPYQIFTLQTAKPYNYNTLNYMLWTSYFAKKQQKILTSNLPNQLEFSRTLNWTGLVLNLPTEIDPMLKMIYSRWLLFRCHLQKGWTIWHDIDSNIRENYTNIYYTRLQLNVSVLSNYWPHLWL